MYMQLTQYKVYPSSMLLATFFYFLGGSSACIGSAEVNSWEGLLSQNSNSAMSDWGSVIAGSHVIFCSQPSNLQKTKISVVATQQEWWIRLLLVCLWFHIEDTVIVLVLISRGIYDEIWRMEHVKQYIPILPDSRLCSLLSSFRQWPSQPLPDRKGQHFLHQGLITCLHVGHDRNCN